jgi:hypothetical protein
MFLIHLSRNIMTTNWHTLVIDLTEAELQNHRAELQHALNTSDTRLAYLSIMHQLNQFNWQEEHFSDIEINLPVYNQLIIDITPMEALHPSDELMTQIHNNASLILLNQWLEVNGLVVVPDLWTHDGRVIVSFSLQTLTTQTNILENVNVDTDTSNHDSEADSNEE